MSENVRFSGTIVLSELKKSFAKACLRLWLGDSLFVLHGSGCGYENVSYHSGFPLWASVFVHCSLVPVSMYALMKMVPGAEPPYWLFHLSSRLSHYVLPFLPSQSIPLCVHLWPLTNHSDAFLCCCQSKRRYDFVFSSFDNCFAFNTHSLFTVGPHLGVFISVKLICLSLNYSIWSNLGFKCEITSSKCYFGGWPAHPLSAWPHSCLVDQWLPSIDISTCYIFHGFSSPVSVYHI